MTFEIYQVESYFSVLRFNSCYQRDINGADCTLLYYSEREVNSMGMKEKRRKGMLRLAMC